MLPNEALEKLKQGNKTFREATAAGEALVRTTIYDELGNDQKPFAVILGCSDSRVPAEIVFDQGLGDLFVIRVAGNIVAPSQIGSVEFACQRFGTQLVVVLGHTRCGAVTATVDSLLTDPDHISPNIAAIVGRVQPAVQPVIDQHEGASREEIIQLSGRANVELSVNSLRERSEILDGLIRAGELKIVGAEYAIDSGEVEFYD
jgi:carbonic anhydrase